jgi:hypothetical protein
VILLLLVIFAIWQFSGDGTNGEPNPLESSVIEELDIWPGFINDADFQGEIEVDRTVTGLLSANETHTWLFRDGPIQLDILVESSPGDNNLIRLYDENSLNWESFIQPRGYSENHLLEPGKQLIAFFDVPADSEYVIAITDLNGNGSEYQLMLTESKPGEIALGETVEGTLIGDNPGVWRYRGEPTTADIILRFDRQSGLLFITDENGRQLPDSYMDTANEANEIRLSNFQLEPSYNIVVRDTSNLGDSYTLVVE